MHTHMPRQECCGSHVKPCWSSRPLQAVVDQAITTTSCWAASRFADVCFWLRPAQAIQATTDTGTSNVTATAKQFRTRKHTRGRLHGFRIPKTSGEVQSRERNIHGGKKNPIRGRRSDVQLSLFSRSPGFPPSGLPTSSLAVRSSLLSPTPPSTHTVPHPSVMRHYQAPPPSPHSSRCSGEPESRRDGSSSSRRESRPPPARIPFTSNRPDREHKTCPIVVVGGLFSGRRRRARPRRRARSSAWRRGWRRWRPPGPRPRRPWTRTPGGRRRGRPPRGRRGSWGG